jgi:hypothetical protein
MRCEDMRYDRPPVTSHMLFMGELVAYGINVFEFDSNVGTELMLSDIKKNL